MFRTNPSIHVAFKRIFPAAALLLAVWLISGCVPPGPDLSLNVELFSVEAGSTYTLVATHITDGDVSALTTWSSSDEAAATVSGGVVTGVAAGTATITTTYGGLTAIATGTVTAPSGGGTQLITLSASTAAEGGSVVATIQPDVAGVAWVLFFDSYSNLIGSDGAGGFPSVAVDGVTATSLTVHLDTPALEGDYPPTVYITTGATFDLANVTKIYLQVSDGDTTYTAATPAEIQNGMGTLTSFTIPTLALTSATYAPLVTEPDLAGVAQLTGSPTLNVGTAVAGDTLTVSFPVDGDALGLQFYFRDVDGTNQWAAARLGYLSPATPNATNIVSIATNPYQVTAVTYALDVSTWDRYYEPRFVAGSWIYGFSIYTSTDWFYIPIIGLTVPLVTINPQNPYPALPNVSINDMPTITVNGVVASGTNFTFSVAELATLSFVLDIPVGNQSEKGRVWLSVGNRSAQPGSSIPLGTTTWSIDIGPDITLFQSYLAADVMRVSDFLVSDAGEFYTYGYHEGSNGNYHSVVTTTEYWPDPDTGTDTGFPAITINITP